MNGKEISVNQTVHEYRAPTDDSMRLLQEMEKKVTDNIVKAFHLRDNVVEAAVIVLAAQPWSLSHKVIIEFKLNGKFHTFEKTMEKLHLTSVMEGQQAAIRMVCETMAEVIAESLILANIDSVTEAVDTSR